MTEQPRRRHVHPFPARMAPEVALDKIHVLTKPGEIVLDPMCGSGTVIRVAAEHGREAVGTDIDPLAVSMSRTACMPAWSRDLEARAEQVVRLARRRTSALPIWIRLDAETQHFVEYWFDGPQRADLARIAKVLDGRPRSEDPLRVALSRLIITKDAGASLARDSAHSRPHRVRDSNDFDVFKRFVDSARVLEAAASQSTVAGSRVRIRRADSRVLDFVTPRSVDLVMTSPPYVNAIDYLRGHRLSLVWLGWTIGELRHLRAEAIGAERAQHQPIPELDQLTRVAIADHQRLPRRQYSMVLRFAHDVDRLCASVNRVLRPRGHLVLVVADSQLRGVLVDNSKLCRLAAARHGFQLRDRTVRPLPAQHRYLPPPSASPRPLDQRMKEEVILTFARAT